MNILHLSPYFPSKNARHAGGVCMGKEIEELSRHHKVYVLCFGYSNQDDAILYKGIDAEKIECIKISKGKRLLHVLSHPFMASMFATRNSEKFKSKLEQILVNYQIEAVHIEYTAMGQYIKLIKRIDPKIQCNLVLHDVTYQSFVRQEHEEKNILKKIFLNWQKKMVKANEGRFVREADHVLTFSNKDVHLIKKYYGVDATCINVFFDVERALLKGSMATQKRKDNTICFFGQMSRPENNHAAMRLSEIVRGLNEVTTYIVGNGPSENLKKQESERFIVTGFVEDPDEILGTCSLAVFPLNVGAGIKIKVLHCMALGIPVITTAIGAEGIDSEGKILDIVETDAEFRDHIQQRLADEKWKEETSRNGIDHIRKWFLWDRTAEIFEKLYHD